MSLHYMKLIGVNSCIYCPPDRRIEDVLRRLNFKEVVNVYDWTHIRLSTGSELLWTPSTYRVPELRLAMRIGELVIWNLVDTHVIPQWINRVLSVLRCESLDVLMLPCQPLLETEIIESIHPVVGPEERR